MHQGEFFLMTLYNFFESVWFCSCGFSVYIFFFFFFLLTLMFSYIFGFLIVFLLLPDIVIRWIPSLIFK